MQGAQGSIYQRIEVPISLSRREDNFNPLVVPSPAIEVKYHPPQEEISLGPACWLRDYLRRSQQSGFFLPLSGGLDSASTAIIVYSMARMVHSAAHEGNKQVLSDMHRIAGEAEDSDWLPENPQNFSAAVFTLVIWAHRTLPAKLAGVQSSSRKTLVPCTGI